MRFKILFTVSFLIISVTSNSQSQNTSSQLEKFSYPFYVKLKNGIIGKATCFFIKHNNISYFVSAKHCFIDPVSNLQRDISFVSIFLNPNNLNEKGWEFSLENKKMLFTCFNFDTTNCADLVVIALDTENITINYVDIKTVINIKDTISKRPLFIVGYPYDTLNIKETKIAIWRGMNSFFYTNEPSSFGASGSPVFIETSKKKYIFIGIYTGRDKGNDYGEVIKAGLLTSLLSRQKTSQ
jgi:V8-like Glu-specific endopeptidase